MRFKPNKRTILFCITECLKKVVQSFPVFLCKQEVSHIVGVCSADPVTLHDGVYIRLNPAPKEAPIIRARLHHDGEVGKLRRALVDVETVEILRDNIFDRIHRRIAVRPVDLNEHVKEIGEDVSAAHAGVDAANLLGAERGCLCTQCSELFCNLLGLLRLLHIVAPSRTQVFVWMPRKPEPPETVLNHVAHDPVGGEELRRSGQGVLRHLDILLEVREHRILRLAVVVLIEPADDLHLILPVLRRDARDKLMDNTAIAQEVLGKEQLGIIADALKHTRKDSV